MIREVAHFFRHMPGVARLSRRMSRGELFDVLLDRSDAAGGAERRRRLVAGLEGEVLEIGCGTGRMFRYYGGGLRLTALEPDDRFFPLARKEAARVDLDIRLLVADAQRLPFPDGAFDAVVVSTVLCSVPSVARTLSELRRVLRPGGRLRLREHVRSERRIAGALMWACNPLWRAYNGQGCNMHRRVHGPLRDAGFRLLSEESYQTWADGLPAFPSLIIEAEPA